MKWVRCRGRRILGIAALGLVLILGLAGWASPRRAWPEATGWNKIPQDQRPSQETQLWAGETSPRLYWLGHSGFLLEWAGTRLLLDPNTSSWCTLAKRGLEPTFRADRLGPIDAALISHAHFDHLDLPTLEHLARLDTLVLPPGNGGHVASLADRGTRVVGLALDSVLPFGELEVIAVPARHNGNRWHPLNSQTRAQGYIIRYGADAIYFAGDTGFGEHFATIRDRYRPRAAILPIGAYAPRFPMAFYHLTPEEAVTAGLLLGVEITIPSHFGTFPLALDRPSWALPRFAATARREGLQWVMPTLLRKGAPQPWKATGEKEEG